MPEFNPMARVVALCLAGLLANAPLGARAQAPSVALDGDDIGGIVAGPNGPEAGVWVIAETTDLPTKLAKIVVTDEQGRYLIPDLPPAKYKVWARGYGLVDGAKADGVPGQTLNLTATSAPNARAAAEAYPGMYWYSMLKIPPASGFPGTGDGPGGNGIPNFMRTQHAWIDTVKQSCQSCHALASQNIRHPKKELGEFPDSYEMWARRIQSGQAMPNMAVSIARLGPELGLRNFADWTDRIAKGELPTSKPRRPEGLERNMVVTLWDWSQPEHYLHDAISTDKRQPTLNANGFIYGSPEESTDLVPVLDPTTHRTWNERHPFMPGTPGLAEEPLGPSPFWGERPIWDGHTSNHNLIMDERGLVWFAARVRAPAAQPAWCKAGGDHPSAKIAPLAVSGRHLSLYDPKTKKWELIDTCFGTHHLYFGYDPDQTLWTSWGPPSGGAVGWLNTRKYLETRDAKASQGWAPMIVDVPGLGPVTGDVAYGGNWFFLVQQSPFALEMGNINALTQAAQAVSDALAAHGITGTQGEPVDHIEFFGPPASPEGHSRNYVLCSGGAYDRSPCGTGTSAKLACLAADGKLPPGQDWVQESIIGSRFIARYRMEQDQVIPYIRGRAYVVGEATLLRDPLDPFAYGLR